MSPQKVFRLKMKFRKAPRRDRIPNSLFFKKISETYTNTIRQNTSFRQRGPVKGESRIHILRWFGNVERFPEDVGEQESSIVQK